MTTPADLYTRTPSSIVMYYAIWCPDCKRAMRFMQENGVTYTGVDVDKDTRASTFVKEINKGMRIVPTIICPDGTIMVEPSQTDLAQKFKKP